MTLHRDFIWSPNQSGRGGARVTHVVLHTAEGALSYQSLGNYFASPSADVSSHTGIDDTFNVVGEYVERGAKAWTASDANPWSVQAELCAFAAWSTEEWMDHPTMLENAAKWVAEEAAAFGLPLANIAANAQDPNARGVCQHNDLGAMGGGHWDCGPGFPIAHVLAMATGTHQPQPEPPPTINLKDYPMTFILIDSGASYLVDTESGFFAPNVPQVQDGDPLPVINHNGAADGVRVACAEVRARA